MGTESVESARREQQLDEVLFAYLKAAEAGQMPDRREWLARHPALANGLQSFFDDQDRVDGLAAPLRACTYIPRDVVEMVAVGEESNNLEKVLLDVANGLEKRTSRQLELFVRLLEPCMLLVMAGVTLLIVAALLLPVFRMGSAIG